MGIPPATFQGSSGGPSDPCAWFLCSIFYFSLLWTHLFTKSKRMVHAYATCACCGTAGQKTTGDSCPLHPSPCTRCLVFSRGIARGDEGPRKNNPAYLPVARYTGPPHWLFFFFGVGSTTFYFYSCLRLPARDQDTARQVHGGSGRIHQQRR